MTPAICTVVSAGLALGVPFDGVANPGPSDVTDERRDVLLEIIRDNDCRVREFSHDPKVVEALEKHKMDHRELRAVSEDLVKDGIIRHWGDVLILRDGSCS